MIRELFFVYVEKKIGKKSTWVLATRKEFAFSILAENWIVGQEDHGEIYQIQRLITIIDPLWQGARINLISGPRNIHGIG